MLMSSSIEDDGVLVVTISSRKLTGLDSDLFRDDKGVHHNAMWSQLLQRLYIRVLEQKALVSVL